MLSIDNIGNIVYYLSKIRGKENPKMKKEEIKVIEIRINELAKAWYKASQNGNRAEEKRIRREERNIEKYLFENHYLIDIRKENGMCSLYVRQM